MTTRLVEAVEAAMEAKRGVDHIPLTAVEIEDAAWSAAAARCDADAVKLFKALKDRLEGDDKACDRADKVARRLDAPMMPAGDRPAILAALKDADCPMPRPAPVVAEGADVDAEMWKAARAAVESDAGMEAWLPMNWGKLIAMTPDVAEADKTLAIELFRGVADESLLPRARQIVERIKPRRHAGDFVWSVDQDEWKAALRGGVAPVEDELAALIRETAPAPRGLPSALPPAVEAPKLPECRGLPNAMPEPRLPECPPAPRAVELPRCGMPNAMPEPGPGLPSAVAPSWPPAVMPVNAPVEVVEPPRMPIDAGSLAWPVIAPSWPPAVMPVNARVAPSWPPAVMPVQAPRPAPVELPSALPCPRDEVAAARRRAEAAVTESRRRAEMALARRDLKEAA